jgi:hypothetical protein
VAGVAGEVGDGRQQGRRKAWSRASTNSGYALAAEYASDKLVWAQLPARPLVGGADLLGPRRGAARCPPDRDQDSAFGASRGLSSHGRCRMRLH